MLVKDVSGKELRELSIKSKRVADIISNSPKEDPTNNSPDTPLINVEVKKPRLMISSSPPVRSPRKSQQRSSEGVDEMRTSFFTTINSSGDGDATSIWDDHFPLGNLIDKNFRDEKFQEKVKEFGLESILQTSLTDSIRMIFLLRVMGQKFGETAKENKAYVREIAELKKMLTENEKNYVGEIAELKNKLSEYEKNMVEMTSLKDELNKLKKTLEYSSQEKNRMVAREKELKKENSSSRIKLLIKEDAHRVTVEKLKAEIEELKSGIELQYKAGYDKALKQVVFFASKLEP